ncbi:MAG TPA: hypothetical protein VL175_21475 [Pirellulales bacterium]|jgi:hypothetical protein|nr:hypothetical protein [Pirellulales bacterium]
MSDFHLVLSLAERDMLVRMLGNALKQKRVEVHRTEFSRDFRHELEGEESRIQGLLERLSQAVATE